MHLAHLAHITSIANQETTSIWPCVLILRHLTYRALTPSWHGSYVLCTMTVPGPLPLYPEHLWFLVAALGRHRMIRRSILITTDPGVFCPDVTFLSSEPGLRSSRRLTSGSHDAELSRPDISLLCLLPPGTLCRPTIILISLPLRAVCPDPSLTFSILWVLYYIISRCPDDASQTRGELSQLCLTQSRSCARSILIFPTSPRDIYDNIAQTPPWRVPFIDSTTSTLNTQIFLYVLISSLRRQTNSIN